LHAAVVERLQAAGGEGVVWGELERNCLVALLTSSDDVAALAWAERLRAALAAEPFELDGVTIPVTASIGVASLISSEAVAEEQARGALRLAQSSGRDCVVSAKEWLNECRRAEDEPAWLDSATAWDIMIPHPLALFPEDTVDQALALLAQTQLAHIPVVDGSGKLLGLVSARSLQHGERRTSTRTSGSLRFVRAIMQTTPKHFDEETPVRELQSFFASEATPIVVVTRNGRPLGLVYSHGLALLEEQLTRSTFAPRNAFSLESDYLTTPETCAVDE
jgi:CBS domain-containing protein